MSEELKDIVEEVEETKEAPEVNEAEQSANEPEAEKEEVQEETEKELSREEELEKQVAELNDKLLRLRAEYDNFRKRTAKDTRSARENGVIETIMPFLQVYDHMKMAEKSIENGDDISAVTMGVKMILAEFQRAISDLSVSEINAEGKEFDPNIHSAVEHKPSDEVEEGKVLAQWGPGYKLGDRVLKPARVVVSSGPEKEESAEEETGE